MSGSAALDLRYPIGGLFVVLGLLLAGFGLVTNGNVEMYRPSGGTNVNLWWGLVMFVVGLVFLGLARRGARIDRLRMSPEGAATEAREKALGQATRKEQVRGQSDRRGRSSRASERVGAIEGALTICRCRSRMCGGDQPCRQKAAPEATSRAMKEEYRGLISPKYRSNGGANPVVMSRP